MYISRYEVLKGNENFQDGWIFGPVPEENLFQKLRNVVKPSKKYWPKMVVLDNAVRNFLFSSHSVIAATTHRCKPTKLEMTQNTQVSAALKLTFLKS